MRKAFFSFLFALFSVSLLSSGAETPFGRTEKVVYAPGEPIRFLFDTDFGPDAPETEFYSLKWKRIGGRPLRGGPLVYSWAVKKSAIFSHSATIRRLCRSSAWKSRFTTWS